MIASANKERELSQRVEKLMAEWIKLSDELAGEEEPTAEGP